MNTSMFHLPLVDPYPALVVGCRYVKPEDSETPSIVGMSLPHVGASSLLDAVRLGHPTCSLSNFFSFSCKLWYKASRAGAVCWDDANWDRKLLISDSRLDFSESCFDCAEASLNSTRDFSSSSTDLAESSLPLWDLSDLTVDSSVPRLASSSNICFSRSTISSSCSHASGVVDDASELSGSASSFSGMSSTAIKCLSSSTLCGQVALVAEYHSRREITQIIRGHVVGD